MNLKNSLLRYDDKVISNYIFILSEMDYFKNINQLETESIYEIINEILNQLINYRDKKTLQ